MRGTPEQIAARWAQRLGNATAEIQAGVDRVTESPGAMAARKADKWHAGVVGAKDKFRQNVGRVTLEDWRASMKNIGVPRIAQGAQQKQNKMAAYMAAVAPHMDAGLRALAAMPDDTFNARVQRSVAWQNHMHNFRRAGSTG
jgi:hypothetical protein